MTLRGHSKTLCDVKLYLCLRQQNVTYLLTPWCRVLLEKLVKKFPHFTESEGSLPHSQASAICLSWANPIQSIYPHPTSWRSILILSTHLRPGLPSGLFPSGFPTKTLYTPSPHPYAPHAQPISFLNVLITASFFDVFRP